jgi:hypothetical protein
VSALTNGPPAEPPPGKNGQRQPHWGRKIGIFSDPRMRAGRDERAQVREREDRKRKFAVDSHGSDVIDALKGNSDWCAGSGNAK